MSRFFLFAILLVILLKSTLSFSTINVKYPVILLNASITEESVLGFRYLNFGEYFKDITMLLENSGIKAITISVKSEYQMKYRAEFFRKEILKRIDFTKTQKVNIIGHSMAGLDAIYMSENLGMNKFIASITTIGTPHNGTPVADIALEHAKNETLLYWFLRLFQYDLNSKSFLIELQSHKINLKSQVPLYSVATFAEGEEVSPLLVYTHKLINDNYSKYNFKDKRNDGLVPIESQVAGTLLSYEKLDHLGQINHFFLNKKVNGEELYIKIAKFLEKMSL